MAKKEKSRKRLYKKLKNKYRLVLMDDESFEEKTSMRLSPMNVFTWGGFSIILLTSAIVSIIAFTPLRELIPGYSNPAVHRNALYAALKADSLEEAQAKNERYIKDIKAIFEDKTIRPIASSNNDTAINYSNITPVKSKEDSVLRALVESEDKYNLIFNTEKRIYSKSNLSSLFFFPPLQGIVSASFNLKEEHYGVDIVASQNEAIKATLDGTVIIATWTSETGYIIQLQHENNLISSYKHNSVLLKKVGEKVKAGEVIAIVGESGELTSGPHLHFELWLNGTPINPENYMVF